ncbi:MULTISPECIES: 3-hydroxyacyl-ACP dehydratase FabZ [Nosocomiicoccus]|uniref:3-hydroxyacyl-[acyl-carrier-protein] dehydratase FabZ n=1 Tax=Nosocomiicoccus massiliensis TaxID=1232430 RepID=A0AAF1BQV2_9STAP|nr:MULTISPECIES: 3-hydroxyacyl-ACP dehydratase FabZ [Nosocomiicoccus]MDK6863734.1 3-hydroxyacyl-ACP dehydratase FabZ [Nosocomiicoccus ampullae]OFL48964.1 beta-hydroxyacyl-ACP dehydratase [Nosocomiicoccus sp. HMSC067E10]OFO54375.1 beta-hydroxyacyl-ACP dehydratase [Nosocomiicoccus sp. HMSC059G07]WOS95393.1 3-hydroxyacyl-ACP dehydratase FabZ [Nosocomiicoccus massiliensis]
MLTYDQIKAIIPHRPPFLLIDRIVEITPGEKCVGIKQVSGNEPFFQGHFPEYAVMPGVLIVEALAQTGAVALLQEEQFKGKLAFFAGIDKCRFKHQVTPGDTLELTVEITRVKGPIGKGKAVAKVGDKVACQCEITFAIGDPAE